MARRFRAEPRGPRRSHQSTGSAPPLKQTHYSERTEIAVGDRCAGLWLGRSWWAGLLRDVEGKRVPISGFEDMCIGLRQILGDHSLENRGHFLRLTEKVKETYDDAPDS